MERWKHPGGPVRFSSDGVELSPDGFSSGARRLVPPTIDGEVAARAPARNDLNSFEADESISDASITDGRLELSGFIRGAIRRPPSTPPSFRCSRRSSLTASSASADPPSERRLQLSVDPDFSFNAFGWTGGWFSNPNSNGDVPGVSTFNANLSVWEVWAGRFSLVGDFAPVGGVCGLGRRR